MSILINLLPDLRQAKARERKRKQVATGVSIAIWVVCGALVVIMGLYNAGQKVIISTNSRDIASTTTKLQNVTGLLDALTAEYDLESLPGLYDQRVYFSKFFQAYSAADPKTISLDTLQVDSANTLTATGAADTYASIAKLARALEASNVTVGTGAAATNTPYFTAVTLSELTSASLGKGVSFKITAQLDSGVTSGSK